MVRYAMEQDENADDKLPRSSWTITGLLVSLASALACTMAYSAAGLNFGPHGKMGCNILLCVVCLICTRKVGRTVVVGSSLAVGSFYRRSKNGETRRLYSDTDVDVTDFERELRQMIWNSKRYNMLPKVDGWLQKYKGKEDELRDKLIQKLNTESKSNNVTSQQTSSTSVSQCIQRHNDDPQAIKRGFDCKDAQEQHDRHTTHSRFQRLDPTPTTRWRQKPTSSLDDAKLEAQLEIDRNTSRRIAQLSGRR